MASPESILPHSNLRESRMWVVRRLIAGLLCGWMGLAPGASRAETAPHPALARIRSKLPANGLPTQLAQAGLRLYRDEMVQPTPRPKPPFTDFVTHDYVLAKITERLVEVKADHPTLKKVWGQMGTGKVKDCLSIFLLLRGDPEGRAPVEQLVADRSRPVRIRELGVRALGKEALAKDDPSVGKLLAQVIREDVQGIFALRASSELHHGVTETRRSTRREKVSGNVKAHNARGIQEDTNSGSAWKSQAGAKKEVVLLYPVRRAAAEAILAMKKRGMLLESFVTVAAEQARIELPLPEQPRVLKRSMEKTASPRR